MGSPSEGERWQQIEQLFDEVVALDPAVRLQHLDRLCGDDAALRGEVLSLLAAYDRAGDFLRLGTMGAGAEAVRPGPPALPPRLQDGTALRAYRILRPIGQGGMGEVYLARDVELDRPVALKLLPVHLSTDEEANARLTAEARAAASLDHPNIATIYEIGEHEGRLFLAMAYYEGETLRERIARGALPPEEALGIARQVAEGLAAAHRKGIVHRDIKPANILLPPDGPVKIVDFGLAKRAGLDLTQAGRTMGTVAYMSPEQVRGEAVNHRTDLWSLGVVLYEMLTGRQPFGGEYEAAVLHAILHLDPPPIRSLRPEVPAEVEQIVRQALAKDPGARYQHAQALIEDLQSGRPRQAFPAALPVQPPFSGTVTLFFSDIEGSTRLLHELGPAYADVLQAHQRQLRAALQAYGGREVDSSGDGFFAVFGRARDAVAAAVQVQRALSAAAESGGAALRVRIGLHTGEPHFSGGRYIGLDVHQVARICAAAHGGQVLLSGATRALVEGDLPEGVHLLDLGLHRLKDLPVPERLFQLSIARLPSRFPPLRAPGSWPNNLPAPPTELIGRAREVREIRQCIREDGARLVTLTGPGGTGKTRLVVRAAAELASDFEDGICFVPLAPLTDAGLVASTVARVLGVRELGGISIRERLLSFLQDQHGLLILDNFEQVIEAAEFVSELLARCPFITILVTSRASLRVQGEHEFAVPPLALPALSEPASPEGLSGYESVALFVARAQAIRRGFALTEENAGAVAEICVRLDGLPLAIELAAARAKVLSPRAILARLERRFDLLADGACDRPLRHRTLREAIAWSYDLLTAREKELFRMLGVFAGGFTVEAAEAVCARSSGPAMEVFDVLTSLVDKNLLRQEEQHDGEPRFFMLETIREFALERLRDAGEEAAARRAHAGFYLQLAEAAAPHLHGPQQVVWMDRLEHELDNLRAALQFTPAADAELAARLLAALWRFWLARGYVVEGYERMARLLAEAGSAISPALRARFLAGAGVLANNMGLSAVARAMLEDSLVLYRQLADKEGTAVTLNHLGWFMLCRGEHERAQCHSEEARGLHAELNDVRGVALSLNNLGFMAWFQGDFARSAALFEESLAWHRRTDDKRGLGAVLSNLGLALYNQGHYARAKALQEQSLALMVEVRERLGQAMSKNRLAIALYQLGSVAHARRLIEEENLPLFRSAGHSWGTLESMRFLCGILLDLGEDDQAEELGKEYLIRAREMESRPMLGPALCCLGHVRQRRGDPDGAAALFRESLRLRREMGEKAGVAECLEGLARVARDRRQEGRAAQLLGAAEAVRELGSAPVPRSGRAAHEALRQDVEEKLGAAACAAAWAAGRAMDLEGMIRFGLEEEFPPVSDTPVSNPPERLPGNEVVGA